MDINLTGKKVLITGASRGIGAAIAESMGKSGARVAIHYNSNESAASALAEKIGNGVKIFKANLEKPQECEKLFKEVVSDFGTLDVLVNNAGALIMSHLEDDNWTEIWDRTMAINLRAVGILCRRAIEHFKGKKNGHIINIASRAAFRGDTAEFLSYAASKGGVVALSKSIARDFGKDGVKCFVIAPGWVRTDMSEESLQEYGEDFVLGGIALDRLTEPKDIAPIVTLLASGLADHATGTTIDINAASYVH